jgi:hypothetical protein
MVEAFVEFFEEPVLLAGLGDFVPGLWIRGQEGVSACPALL